MRKHLLILIIIMAGINTHLHAQKPNKIKAEKTSHILQNLLDSNQSIENYTAKASYVENGTIKTIQFTARGYHIKSVIKTTSQFEEQTTFYVNNRAIRIYGSFDSSCTTNQYGGMNIVSSGMVAYSFYYIGGSKPQTYLMLTAFAETALGSFALAQYYYFLPLSPSDNLGFTLFNQSEPPSAEPENE